MPLPPRYGLLASLLLFAACSSSGPSTNDAADAAGDGDVADHAGAAETGGVDGGGDDGLDGSLPDVPAEHAPVACGPATACNERLDGQHLCPGACVSVVGGPACHGEVLRGLCFGRPPTPYPDAVSGDGFELKLRSKPDEARVGDAVTVSFDVVNTSGSAAEARVGIKPGAKFTLVDTGDFNPAVPLSLGAGAARTITAHLHADAAGILSAEDWSALDVTLGGTSLDPRGLRIPVPVAFATGPRVCGAHVFPDFNTELDRNYGTAACCGGVFFPGAQCCGDADCAGGATCADGICVAAAPDISFSGSPLAGPQRVLIVMADEPDPKPPTPRALAVDVCADHAAERAEVLGLPLIGEWFADVARRRVGRALTDFRFTVLAGLKTEDFAPANNLPMTYGAALEAHLVSRGCTNGWGRDFDRVVVFSPRVDTGSHQGLVYAADRIAVQAWSPSIATHELAHSFGATDRYFDVGGQLQYAGALMSTVDREPAALADTVFWAEAGLADLDRDGLIDALAFSRAPDRLVAKQVTVEARKNSRNLLIDVRVGAEEGGASLVVMPRAVQVELVDAAVTTTMTIDGHRPGLAPAERDRYVTALGAGAGRELPDASFDAIVAAGKLRLRLRVDHAYTDAQFQRKVVSLDETREVSVTVVGNVPQPLARR